MRTRFSDQSDDISLENYDVREDISHKLDVAKQWNKIPSDYQLAKIMGITQSALINYRKGKTLPDEKTIFELCKLTGDDPYHLAAHVQSERSKTKEAKELWMKVALRLSGGVAHVFALAMIAILSLTVVAKDGHAAPYPTAEKPNLCILCQIAFARLFGQLRKRFLNTIRRLKGTNKNVQSTDTDASAFLFA